MKPFPKISIEPTTQNSSKIIVDGLNKYNLNIVDATSAHWTPLEFVAKNDKGNEIGGILAGIGYWSGLEIKILWIEEAYRNMGIGTQLLQHIEKVAQNKGAQISMLDTFDFQAEEFYLKNGYKIIGEIKNFPKGHRRIYLYKRLT